MAMRVDRGQIMPVKMRFTISGKGNNEERFNKGDKESIYKIKILLEYL